jgi:hypothetical protein
VGQKSFNNPPNRKDHFYQKAALQIAPFKSAKITGFQVLFKLGQNGGKKNIFQLK